MSDEDKIIINLDLFRRVSEIDFSLRSANCLRNENITYIGDLVQKTETEMRAVPNFGIKSLNEIKEILFAMGLHLDMNIPNWPPENVEEIAREVNKDVDIPPEEDIPTVYRKFDLRIAIIQEILSDVNFLAKIKNDPTFFNGKEIYCRKNLARLINKYALKNGLWKRGYEESLTRLVVDDLLCLQSRGLMHFPFRIC